MEERLRKRPRVAEYGSVKHVCNNSNKCERAFSGTKRVMTDQRKSMDPSTLEMVTMLDFNDDLWDARDVQEFALAAKRPGELQDEDEDLDVPPYEPDSDEEDNVGGAVDMDVDINLADD